MQKIRVLLADDHTVLRQGIAQVLENQEDMEVVAHANNGNEAVELTRVHEPDVVLIDINMPEMDGVEATQIIKDEFPDIGVLILTMYQKDEHLVDAIKAGASGYLLKEVEMSVLVSSIRRVSSGEAVVDPAMVSSLLVELRGESEVTKSEYDDNLSERDVDILRLLGQGMSNQEIAETLFLSEKTVRNRLSLVFKQLNLKNRTEAALYALRKGLVNETGDNGEKD
ncbi:MAG: response regulator transcription factor [Chloroflexi bacterium]|nr:response regulator transcription factor [Chloroflexota bacterium]